MRTFLLIVSTLALAACSSSSGGAPTVESDTGAASGEDTGAPGTDVGGTEDVAAVDTTPPPACGNKVGDILCDVDLQGYLRNESTGLATSVPATTFKTSEVLAAGSQPYAFIFNTAYW